MAITSVILWLITAVLGLNLAVRSGSLEDLVIRQRRKRAGRRAVLLAIHILAAVGGLALWVWFLIAGPSGAVVESLLLLVVAASHGLLMVSRWVPGHGRHAAPAPSQRHRARYFPVHAATLHAMMASSTLTMVLVTAVAVFRH